MGTSRSFALVAVLGLAVSCQPQVTEVPLTPEQAARIRKIEHEATLSDLRQHTRTTPGSPLRTVLVKTPDSPNCVLRDNSVMDDRGRIDRCQEEFAASLSERIDALLADRATNGTCVLRDVEVLHARIIWRGSSTGGPAMLPSGALVFMNCCGEPTPYPCSEVRR